MKVSGVSVQDLAPQLPDTRKLTPETYNIVLIAHSLRQPASLLQSTVLKKHRPLVAELLQSINPRDVNNMMNSDEIDITGQQFLIQLFEQTKGDSAVQVSMYDIGDQLDLDRDSASAVAQELIGCMLVEIRTLSGGIGISGDGLQMAQRLIGPTASSGDEFAKLDDAPLLNSSGRQAVERIASELKQQAGSLGLDFDTLTELMADLKTIEAQLGSSRPKTAIIRACLFSVQEVLKNSDDNKIFDRLRMLVGS